MKSNATFRFSSEPLLISTVKTSLCHGVYALRRSCTRSQVISSKPCSPRIRASSRLRWRLASLSMHSITTIDIFRLVAQSIQTCFASFSAFTASITTELPSLICSLASASATRYAAYPVSKLLGMPALIIADSIGSTEKTGIFRLAAILSDNVLLPLPGRPDITISLGLFIKSNYNVGLKARTGFRIIKLFRTKKVYIHICRLLDKFWCTNATLDGTKLRQVPYSYIRN